ncbi:MAG TPA: hypothetical protein VFA82_02300 [Gaiellaceae bacterium]|nr:hypothetical protein [Gaiellaceae bacterium]
MTRRLLVLPLLALVAAGCGGSSGGGFPTIQAARTYSLAGFAPARPVPAGRPVRVSFTIRQPDGRPLTRFRHGAGPHNGVHLIIVRRDLATLVHVHPPVAANGTISTVVSLADPGPYRVVVDAYPQTNGPQRNFQLFGSLRVAGAYRPVKLPPYRATAAAGGYRITLRGTPALHAIQAGFLQAEVTGPNGRPARFQPWFGALAHAIFFRAGSLDYFHTHVCAPGAAGCTSVLGGAKVTGSSATPGKLTIGVLVPAPGTWRLFLQCKVAGRVLTAPFTLVVKP